MHKYSVISIYDEKRLLFSIVNETLEENNLIIVHICDRFDPAAAEEQHVCPVPW